MLEMIMANLPILACFLLGIGLLIVEVFMPGFGLPGITGIVLEVVCIALTYFSHGSLAALGVTLIILAVIAIAVSLALRSANKGRLAKSAVILTETESVEEGYVATKDMDVFVGKIGTTTTVLRPTGMAEFDGVKLNVQSDGEYVAKGEMVRVDRVDGSRIVVQHVKASV